jgi:vesicle-fusing ATPase
MFNRFGGGGGGNNPPPREGYQNYSRPQQTPSNYGGDTRMGGYGDPRGGYGDPRGGYGALVQRAPVGGGGPAPGQRQNIPVRSGLALQLQPEKSHGGNNFAYANLVSVSAIDFGNQQELYIIVNGQYVFTARPIQQCPPGHIGFTDSQRSWARIGLGPGYTVNVERYEPMSEGDQGGYMCSVDCQLSFKLAKKTTDHPYDQQMLNDIFVHTFENQILAPGQILLIDVNNIPLELKLSNVELVDLSQEKESARPPSDNPNARGIVTKRTQVTFYKDPSSGIKLKGMYS